MVNREVIGTPCHGPSAKNFSNSHFQEQSSSSDSQARILMIKSSRGTKILSGAGKMEEKNKEKILTLFIHELNGLIIVIHVNLNLKFIYDFFLCYLTFFFLILLFNIEGGLNFKFLSFPLM